MSWSELERFVVDVEADAALRQALRQGWRSGGA